MSDEELERLRQRVADLQKEKGDMDAVFVAQMRRVLGNFAAARRFAAAWKAKAKRQYRMLNRLERHMNRTSDEIREAKVKIDRLGNATLRIVQERDAERARADAMGDALNAEARAHEETLALLRELVGKSGNYHVWAAMWDSPLLESIRAHLERKEPKP